METLLSTLNAKTTQKTPLDGFCFISLYNENVFFTVFNRNNILILQCLEKAFEHILFSFQHITTFDKHRSFEYDTVE